MRHFALFLLVKFPLLTSIGLMSFALASAAPVPCTPAGLAAAVSAGGAYQFDCDGVITLPATLVVTSPVTLDAAGHQVTLAAGGAVQLFSVAAVGSLNLVGLTLTGGSSTQGGAVRNDGTLSATGCAFVFNSAMEGGAVYNTAGGQATFSQCLWASNRVTGAMSTNGTSGTPPARIAGGSAAGGAIWNAGTLELQRSVLRWNIATGGNGGHGAPPDFNFFAAGQGGAGAEALGGGLYQGGGVARLIDSTFHDNQAQGGQGGAGGPGTCSCGIVSDGGHGGQGGAARGAAIYAAGGQLSMTNGTLATSRLNGGRGGAGGGGGSTGRSGLNGGNGGQGGSVFGSGLGAANAVVRMSQSTLSGNDLIPGNGGTAGSGAGGTTSSGHPGLPGQPGASGGSGVANLGGSSASVELINTLLGLSTAPICHGPISDLGHNLCADGSCLFTAASAQGIDPQLGPLADHGGGVPTMALLTGSAAIDAADAAATATDARGVSRPKGAMADIGAFESDLTSAGALFFSQVAYAASESAATVSFHVLRGGGSSGAITVTFTATPGTASNGADFIATNVVLAFAAGENARAVTILLRDDVAAEGPETVLLRLTGPTGGATLGPVALATLTLGDDEGGGLVADCTEAALLNALSLTNQVRFLCDGVIRLTAPITVSSNVVLDATGRAVTLSGGNSNRLFQISPDGMLTLSNLTLADGRATNRGGAVEVDGGTLRCFGGVFRSNRVAALPTPQGFGHGRSVLGGAVYATNGVVTLIDVQLSANEARGGDGNSFSFGGQPQPTGGDGGSSSGGAIYATGGSLQLERAQLSGNRATPGAPGQGWFEGGRSGDVAGGAIGASNTSLILADARLLDNSSSSGSRLGMAAGGALHLSQGSLRMVNTLVSNNRAIGSPAASWQGQIFGGGGASGGGLFQSGGVARITNCAFVENLARGGEHTVSTASGGTNSNRGGPGLGGAIAWNSASALILVNSTMASNVAQGGSAIAIREAGSAWGGGLALQAGSATLRHLSLAGNRATLGAGGLPGSAEARGDSLFTSNATVSVQSSLLAAPGSAGNCDGLLVDAGHNLSSDASAGFTAASSRNNTDPLLLPLGYYGGPTPTFALRVDSPAVDGGSDIDCPSTDQRGVLRPQGGQCDIGAFERNPVRILKVSANTLRIFGWGVPATAHLLQSATVFGDWQDGPMQQAGADGSFSFLEPSGSAPRFFRVIPAGPPGAEE